MKSLLAAVLAAATAQAAAFRHSRRHPSGVAKRANTVVVAPASLQTIVLYELEGHLIDEDDVRQGIANGTLMWGDDGNLSTSIRATIVATTSSPQSSRTVETIFPSSQPKDNPGGQQIEPHADSPPSIASSIVSSATPPAMPTQSAESPKSSTIYQPVVTDGHCADCDKEFPNGSFSCSEFPAGYGAVFLSGEGLGGWTGIQDPGYVGNDGYDDILTVPKGSCKNGACCTPGRFCSYGCPNPYLKMAWPKLQGKTKQSVGGLYCNSNGKLEMPDGSIAKTLCGKGTDKMTVKAHNKLSQSVSICRTDYPGTESETIPITVAPGETVEIANPEQGKYFFWDGRPTSAQYYINKKGISEEEACTWGSGKKTTGNWAPLNFGTSWDDINMHVGFPSLSQNKPTTQERLDFTVTFTGEGVTDPCQFKHTTGEYCQGDKCGWDLGCTASVKEGSTLTLEFTE